MKWDRKLKMHTKQNHGKRKINILKIWIITSAILALAFSFFMVYFFVYDNMGQEMCDYNSDRSGIVITVYDIPCTLNLPIILISLLYMFLYAFLPLQTITLLILGVKIILRRYKKNDKNID